MGVDAILESLHLVKAGKAPIIPQDVAGAIQTEMRAKAFPGEDPKTLPTSEDVAPLFLELAAPECTLNGRVVNFREWQKPKPKPKPKSPPPSSSRKTDASSA